MPPTQMVVSVASVSLPSSSTLFFPTRITLALRRTITPFFCKARSARPRMGAENCGKSSLAAWMRVILTPRKSASSPANSTPVAPPPITTKLLADFFSRFLMAMASGNDFNVRQFSAAPGVLKKLVVEPKAITR